MSQLLRKRLVDLIARAKRGKQEARERLRDEAKTSMFVFLCLYDLFKWDPFAEVTPQKVGHGFIDYVFEPKVDDVACHVEVKRFGEALRADHIRKYLVGRMKSSLRIGVLTNLANWHVYAYSTVVGPREPIKLLDLNMTSIRSLKRLEQYLTYWRGVHGFKPLRDLYAVSPEVVAGEIRRKEVLGKVATFVRVYLGRYRRFGRPGLMPRGNQVIEEAVKRLLEGKTWTWREREKYRITSSECENALLAKETLGCIASAIRTKIHARISLVRMKGSIQAYIQDQEARRSGR